MAANDELGSFGVRIAFGLVLVVSILLVGWTFAPLWQPLLLASVLSSVTYGWHQWLSRRLGKRARLAAAFMTVGLVIFVLVPIAAVISVLVQQAVAALSHAQEALERGGVRELVKGLPPGVEHLLRQLVSSLPVDLGALSSQAAAGGWTLARFASDVLAGVSKVLFGLAMMLIAYFALLVDGPGLLRWVGRVSPLGPRRTAELFGEFRRVSRSVLGSTLLSAFAQAVVAGIGYAIAGVPNALFFAVLTGLAGMIPAVGTPVVTLPIAAFLLASGETWQGIFLAVYWLLVISVVDNVVKPLVVRGGMQLNGAVVLFSLIGGLLAFGAIGLIVGPLAVTFFLAMVRFTRRDLFGGAIRGDA